MGKGFTGTHKGELAINAAYRTIRSAEREERDLKYYRGTFDGQTELLNQKIEKRRKELWKIYEEDKPQFSFTNGLRGFSDGEGEQAAYNSIYVVAEWKSKTTGKINRRLTREFSEEKESLRKRFKRK